MSDIANLGFNVDTGSLKDATASLKAIVPAADGVGKSADKASASINKTADAVSKVDAAAAGASASVNKVAAAIDGTANVSTAAAGAMNSVAAATTGALAGSKALAAEQTNIMRSVKGASTEVKQLNNALRDTPNAGGAAGAALGQLDAHVMAYRQNLRQATIDALKGGKDIKFTAQDNLNAMRQLSDIGTTLAMGMNPFMVAIQQGPQLLDILQNKAAVTGNTLGTVFKAAGAAIWAALAPFLPLILSIAAAVGVVAAAFALGTREINKNSKDVVEGLNLTEKELRKLKKAGVETTVTMGDTFKAFFQVIGSRIADAFEGPTKKATKWINDMLDNIVKYGKIGIAFYVGLWIGAYHAIKNGWSLLPAALGDIVFSSANLIIQSVEWLINKSIDGINFLLKFANGAAAAMGIPGLGEIQKVSLGNMGNPFAGKAKEYGNAIVDGMKQGLKESKGVMDRFWSDVDKTAKKNARKRITEALGERAKAPKGPKSDAAKFEDIVRGAENDIAKEKARGEAAAIEMTAQATATLEYRTKLLGEANSKNIKLTDAMRAKIDQLADAYGKAKVAADDAIAMRDIMKGADADIAKIDAETAAIGKYGRELAYITELEKLNAEARAKKMTPEAIAAAQPQFQQKAAQFADASNRKDALQFMEQSRKASKEAVEGLQAEYDQIGMNADQMTRYKLEHDLLAQARQKNIDLTPVEIQALKDIAAGQAEIEIAVRKTREAIDFARDTTKGFVTDVSNGLRQGMTLWGAFAQAAVNALNKIIDKLLDSALNTGLNALFGTGGGSGLGGLIGGLFGGGKGGLGGSIGWGGDGLSLGSALGGATGFAQGDVFNKPTSFNYGNGGTQLGVMGEKGPEAVMPLQRGPNGTLGVQTFTNGSNGGDQRVAVDLSVTAVESEMFRPVIREISQEESANAVQAGIRQYDQEMPTRMKQISNDDRVRG